MSAIYQIWRTNQTGSKSEVPIWVLVFGGAAISIGLWTYGYNLMRNLGNRITLHSPSRGFCMELGAALTVVMATRLALPVSTTQCIIGATVGVGLCAGDYKAINWRMVCWSYGAWFGKSMQLLLLHRSKRMLTSSQSLFLPLLSSPV